MIVPLPNCFSIWESAASMALWREVCFSSVSASFMGPPSRVVSFFFSSVRSFSTSLLPIGLLPRTQSLPGLPRPFNPFPAVFSHPSPRKAVEHQVVVVDQALVGKAEVAVVPDNDGVEDLDLNDSGGGDEGPGDLPVAEGRLGVAGRVVMGEDQRRRFVAEGVLDDLPGIDGARVGRPLEQGLLLDDLVLRVEEDDLEPLLLQVAQGVAEVVVDLLGGGADGPAPHTVLEEAARDLVDELQAEDVPGADPRDPLGVLRAGLAEPAEGLEFPQGPAGRRLAVPPG